MRQRVHLITLGVDDLDRAAAFYQALGWQPVPETPPNIRAFDLYGATLGLYSRADLAKDLGADLPTGSGAVTLSANTRDEAETDAVMTDAEAAGAMILRSPASYAWGGYGGAFRDPEGHVWEVIYNPYSPLGPNDEFQWTGAN